MSEKARNVLGGELADCSEHPLTGFSATAAATRALRIADLTPSAC